MTTLQSLLDKITQQKKEIRSLQYQCENLNGEINELNSEIDHLERQKSQLETLVQELQYQTHGYNDPYQEIGMTERDFC